jgi:NADH dehydrogenase FAD-containing subunit
MSKISLDKKSVVIVGGGHAGTALAKKLSSSLDPSRYNLTLINARPFFILYPATARLVVSAHHDLDGRVFMPYDQLFEKNGSFKLGTVTAIEKHTRGGDVILETGERVKFDVVVLATGSKWDGALSFPNTSVEAKDWIERTRARISAAKDIVLVGGGAVGIGKSSRCSTWMANLTTHLKS